MIPKKLTVMTATKNASTAMVIIAFATVYLVWGSTYFFYTKAVQHIPAFIMGSMQLCYCRFTDASPGVFSKEDI